VEKATVVSYPDDFAIQEIKELAKAAGYSVAELITQKKVVKSEYGVGVGKAEELRRMIRDNGSKVLIVDEELNSSQTYKLSELTKVPVIDRDRLILNIFAKRAVTAEAKLQVQLAELRYEIPRVKANTRHSKTGERAGYMGIGELAVDVQFRALKRRMQFVKQKLEKAQSFRSVQRTERRKLDIPFVSLAGYTSSGKTTLFNRLTSESREESPDLFTTLTTTTRAITLGDPRKKIMLSDTVGFVSRLPTYMVESFKSTLEELTYADLILLLLDASESDEAMQIKLVSCQRTMYELGVDPKKVLLVLNKIDLVKDPGARRIEEDELFKGMSILKISAVRGDGLRQLRNRIMSLTYPEKAPLSY
jgi:GTP-binding protein HflX